MEHGLGATDMGESAKNGSFERKGGRSARCKPFAKTDEGRVYYRRRTLGGTHSTKQQAARPSVHEKTSVDIHCRNGGIFSCQRNVGVTRPYSGAGAPSQ